ncbi:MAG: hypothetical protein JNK14_05785 [Chitinophagaceae bacterium]|nr:hypothetical protein [Chitinophagaceae bacterium]
MLDQGDASPYLVEFECWIKKLLPSDKADAFLTLMQFPLYSNSLIETVQDELAKVFDSQNSSFTYEFSNDTDRADFEYYLNNYGFAKWWRENSLTEMVSNISSLLVVDMPKGDTSARPDPYTYFLPMTSLVDIGVSGDRVIYVMAQQEGDLLLVIDDTAYRLFDYTQKKVGAELLNAPHELGYTPVCFFWKTNLNKKYRFVKESPVTGSLTNLNWLIYFEIARRAMEMYASYPIDITYKEKCSYSEEKNGIKYVCDGGYLNRGEYGKVKCPSCEKNRMVGPGTHLKVPMPMSKEQANVIDAMKRISADVPSLEWAEKRRDSIWDEIYYGCTGWGGEEMTKEAVNEKQVKANYESKQNVLLRLKENLEASHRFVVSTMAALRYGSSFISADINYGNKWYLQTSYEAVDEFKTVKASGAPVYLIAEKRNQVDAVCVKGNDLYAARLDIIKQLEPWPDLSLNDCKANELDKANYQEFILKAGLSGFIMRFEREYGSIVDFGKLIDFSTKIDRIKTKLLEYASESAPKEPAEPAEAGEE